MLTDYGDKWTGGQWTEHFHSWQGQVEYWIVMGIIAAMRMNRNLPIHTFGIENSLALYLAHWSYSPFVDHPIYKEKQALYNEGVGL